MEGLRLALEGRLPSAVGNASSVGGGVRAFLTFAEIVATGGWSTESSTVALRAKAAEAGFDPTGTRFVSAFASRADAVVREALQLQPACVKLWFADEAHLGTMRFRASA